MSEGIQALKMHMQGLFDSVSWAVGGVFGVRKIMGDTGCKEDYVCTHQKPWNGHALD